MQYLTKILGLTPYFVIFDALPSQSYAANYEVFEETEPVLDTISVLNQSTSDFQSNDDVYIDSLNIMNRKEEKIIEEKKAPNEENHDEQEPSSLWFFFIFYYNIREWVYIWKENVNMT